MEAATPGVQVRQQREVGASLYKSRLVISVILFSASKEILEVCSTRLLLIVLHANKESEQDVSSASNVNRVLKRAFPVALTSCVAGQHDKMGRKSLSVKVAFADGRTSFCNALGALVSQHMIAVIHKDLCRAPKGRI